MENQVLVQCGTKEMNARQAYKALYRSRLPKSPRRAHFIKLRITIPESKGTSRFLAFLFLLPVPLFYVRIGLGFVKAKDGEEPLPIPKSEIMRLLHFRGIRVQVDSHDGTHIDIRTL
jgi:hypothetical protein